MMMAKMNYRPKAVMTIRCDADFKDKLEALLKVFRPELSMTKFLVELLQASVYNLKPTMTRETLDRYDELRKNNFEHYDIFE
jgi:hypothetical protein